MAKTIGEKVYKVIDEIRSSESEEDVIKHYMLYTNQVWDKASNLKISGPRREKIIRELAQNLEEVTSETAKRISDGDTRISLAYKPSEFGECFGISWPAMTLPVYEEIPTGGRKWRPEEIAAIREYVEKVCAVLSELGNERLDKWVTVEELREKAREASFFVEFILKQLEKIGTLEFRHILLSESGETLKIQIVYILKPCPVTKRSVDKILCDFEKKGQIPYKMIRLLPKSKLYR